MNQMTQSSVVAAGTWYYDGLIPHRVEIHRFPARLSASRLADEAENISDYDESLPIPETLDGYLYECRPFFSGEHVDGSRQGLGSKSALGSRRLG